MIAQEQNRIANEIHDNVSQRLFSITCAAHVLISKLETNNKEELEEQLLLIKYCASTAMQELRSSIYRLSSKKRGENTLEVSLKAYLDSISKLNKVSINFTMTGNGEKLSYYLKTPFTE